MLPGSSLPFSAFASYAHRDETNSGGAISRIANALQREYEFITGSRLTLFLDRDSTGDGLQWGDEWEAVIESNLQLAAFFIPFITPAYLQSQNCRKEFVSFHSAAVRGKSEGFILPILLAPFESLREDDEVVEVARSLQWRDWTMLRLLDPGSEPVTTEVAEMAFQLVKRAGLLRPRNPNGDVGPDAETASEEPPSELDDLSEPGDIDKIATAEDAIPAIGDHVTEIGTLIAGIGVQLEEFTANAKTVGSFKGRVSLTKQLAAAIADPVEAFYQHAAGVDTEATRADPGTHSLLDMVEVSDPTADGADSLLGLLEGIISAAAGIRKMAVAGGASRATLRPLLKNSQDLRPRLQRLLDGFTFIESADATISTWGDRAESLIKRFKP